jgi:hypothetical protein
MSKKSEIRREKNEQKNLPLKDKTGNPPDEESKRDDKSQASSKTREYGQRGQIYVRQKRKQKDLFDIR